MEKLLAMDITYIKRWREYMSKVRIFVSEKVDIELDIDERLTIIGGDSGTGKTYIVNALYGAVRNPGIIKIDGINTNKLVVCRDEDAILNIKNKHKYFIVIDRYDSFSVETKKFIAKEMERCDCTWLIMSRYADIRTRFNIGYSTKSFKKLVYIKDKDKVKLETRLA